MDGLVLNCKLTCPGEIKVEMQDFIRIISGGQKVTKFLTQPEKSQNGGKANVWLGRTTT